MFQYVNSVSVPVRVEIANLMHSSQEEYSKFSTLSTTPVSRSGEQWQIGLDQLVSGSVSSSVKNLENFFTSSLDQLRTTSRHVHDQSQEIETLRAEIQALKQSCHC
eukprot:TRINITY_DN1907_c0_g1_i1.p1 TRINITY_DN1907_c0_g1~~TRINITY_DN1907_c0_g1_i1.p1  ORF type:complete len:106 (+),score=9.53 TRINITY_DN1907_c0_g1_i1:464-781(+)